MLVYVAHLLRHSFNVQSWSAAHRAPKTAMLYVGQREAGSFDVLLMGFKPRDRWRQCLSPSDTGICRRGRIEQSNGCDIIRMSLRPQLRLAASSPTQLTPEADSELLFDDVRSGPSRAVACLLLDAQRQAVRGRRGAVERPRLRVQLGAQQRQAFQQA